MPVQSRKPAEVSHPAGEAQEALAVLATAGGPVAECFEQIPDPRDPRGVRHRLPVVLSLCAAVLCGESGLAGVAAWVAAEGPGDPTGEGCRWPRPGIAVDGAVKFSVLSQIRW
ncbi:transposase family protein [Frankia sp. B2]|uniref:transposase family protein n=1 Tax=Frankia sp. B2 TaxID=2541730 RepID=UPI00141A781C|nr:transposase family protein [Frankia sp. B2]